MTYPFGETVTRHRPTAEADPYSGENTDLDWDAAVDTDFTGIAVEPGPSAEAAEAGRSRLDVDFTLYGPFEWDIRPLDQVTVRGQRCTVEGARADWRNPYTGNEPGSVVEVKRVAG